MKKGFTLLELIVVIIIIGILATLGFSQYTRMVERSRGAEARSVLGSIRTMAAALWIEYNNGATMPAATLTDARVGIGTTVGLIASACNVAASPSYYFSYGIAQNAGNTGFVATATRCVTAGTGKQPTGTAPAGTLTLTTDFVADTDVWGGTGDY